MKIRRFTSDKEIARWFALIKALNVIEKKCSNKKINIDDVTLPPIDIKHYMDEVEDSIHYMVQEDKNRSPKDSMTLKFINQEEEDICCIL
jgi:hypothetical protein